MRTIRYFILPAVISVFLAASAFAAETNAPPNDLSDRIKNTCAQKKIDDRLNALANLAKTVSLAELPQAIKASDDLKQLRERVVFKQSVLKR